MLFKLKLPQGGTQARRKRRSCCLCAITVLQLMSNLSVLYLYDIWNGSALTAAKAEAEGSRPILEWWNAAVYCKELAFSHISLSLG